MGNFIKVIIFSLLVLGFYTGFSAFYIPPIEPSPPPPRPAPFTGIETVDQLLAVGEELFTNEQKGNCNLCHNPVGGRAPKLAEAAGKAMDRIADARYGGSATDVAGYLMESLTDPSAFVVATFGKKGTNDKESPMTNFGKSMQDFEIKALAGYLENLGGAEVTIELPIEATIAEGGETAAPAPPAATPEEALVKYGCGACHTHAGAGLEGAVGPDLSAIGASKDVNYLRRSILDPDADLAEGFEFLPGVMPPTLKDSMTAGELEMIVGYLANSK